MYIQPMRFLWKQLNGPQITAYLTALYRHITTQLNPLLHYLTEFSISTANDKHLTLLGVLGGITRPMVSIANATSFLFTYEAESDRTYGVSAAPGPLQVGGIFSDLYTDVITRSNRLCPTEFYRAVLQALQASTSPVRNFSIAQIDEMLAYIWNRYHPDEDPVYTFTWLDHSYPDQSMTNEDIRITLGPLPKWGTQETAVIWQAVFEGIINSVIGPTRKVQVVFSNN